MKKLIAIAVVFALVAGAAFAETSVSGSISVRAKLLSDTLDDNDDTKATTSGEIETAYVQLSGQNDEGTFGALARLRANENASKDRGPNSWEGTNNNGTLGNIHRAFVWWRPIPQLEVFFGKDDDGKFSPYNAWSHFQGQEGYHHDHNWRDWRRAMGFTNWDTFGLAFTVKPVQGLEFNLVVPAGLVVNADYKKMEAGDRTLESAWGGGLQLTANYAIPDIGRVYFGIKGPAWADQNSFPGNRDYTGGENFGLFDDDYTKDYGIAGLAFQLSAVENLDLMLGGSMGIPGEDSDGDAPVYIALMANYNFTGEFGIKTRWRFSINGTDGYTPYAYAEDRTTIAFDVQPFYNLGILTAYLNIGLVATTVGDADPGIKFVLNPYIRKGMGPGEIRFGVLFIDPNLDNDNDATIALPLTFGFSF
ncbi:MAG: hypothetical protein FWF55_05535 [Treponema sp.]|nr:hypothetical protein [Treponema sp.]